ncbi:MAG: tetratricopeptide repeat protein [Chloroflexota bacterium]
MTQLEIHMLGTFEARLGDRLINNFPTAKVRALLAYLAAEGDHIHTRTALATLVWGDVDEASARSNLRNLLFRLRKVLKEESDNLLTVSRSDIEFHIDRATIDLHTFSRLTQSDRREDLEMAATLYRGEFLTGLEISGAPAFDEWLINKREQLHQQILTTLSQLTELYFAEQAYAPALETASRQLALEAWRESAFRQLMRIHSASGNRAAALAQYDRCVTVLEAELGVEPSAETEQLASSIRGEQLLTTHLYHFSTPKTPFVGREADINRIIARLNVPGTRLVTVTGTGGVGKTRLVKETVIRSLGNREAYFIPLENVTSQAAIWQLVGDRLNIPPGSRGISERDVIDFLEERSPLLVFDNYEHLLPSTSSIDRILAETSDAQLLLTSRMPLKLRSEWRLAIEGLLAPPEGAEAEIEQYPAVVMLVSIGQQVDSSLEVTLENSQALAKICRLLGGMPLALEMAGSWLALFTPDDLLEEVQRNLDLLVATRQDLPERHQSLRAIFDHTMQQLGAAEQTLLTQLGCFYGDFSLKDVLAIVGGSPLVLNNLIDHAVLQKRTDNRFGLHPLIGAFIKEKGAVEADLQSKHVNHYLRLVGGLADQEIGAMVAEIWRNMANVRGAWRYAVSQELEPLISSSLDGLLSVYQFKGSYREGADLFSMAADVIKDPLLINRLHLAKATCLRNLGEVEAATDLIFGVKESGLQETYLSSLIRLGNLYEEMSQFDKATALLDEGLELAEEYSTEAIDIWTTLGKIYGRRVEGEKSIEAHQTALKICKKLGDDLRAAENHANVAITYRDITDYEAAFEHIERALEIVNRLAHREYIGRYTHYKASIYWQQDDLDEAYTLWQEAVAIAESINNKRNIVTCCGGLGIIASRRFQFDLALQFFQRARKLAEELGEHYLQAVNINNMGGVYLRQKRFEAAFDHFSEAAEINRRIESFSGLGINIGNKGQALVGLERYEEALHFYFEAIDLFRERKMRYYLCWALIGAADCLLELDRLEEAETYNQEGVEIATEIERASYVVQGGIITAKLLTKRGQPGAPELLNRLADQYEDLALQAELAFVLWEITKEGQYQTQATKQFTELYATAPRLEYKDRLTQLTGLAQNT